MAKENKETKEVKKPVKASKKENKEPKKEKKVFSKLIGRKEKPVKEEQKVMKNVMDPYDILQFVLMTEKSVRMIEMQNKLVFIVNRKAGKEEIANAAQTAFNGRVASVTTLIDQKGRKKAFVKFQNPGEAGEIAIRLGII